MLTDDPNRIDETLDLAEQIERYPNLRSALGSTWIRQQTEILPELSRYALARWLRRRGFVDDLSQLDEVLGDLHHVPGIADRRRRLRSDPAGFEETLTELWFAAWLRSHQRSFEWPPQGSDFVISLDPATTLPLEATTPRQARWMQDLFERLHLVALRFGYEVRVDHEAEMLPTGFDPEQVVISTVTDILNTLRTTTGRSKRRPRFIYKELALTITMKPSIDPVILQSSYSGPVSSYWGFEYIVAAARAKAAQLPRSAPSALLLGTRQLPDLIWNRFIDTLRRDPTFDQGLEWSRMPAHITYVLLFTFNLKSIQPFEAFVLTNPESPFEHPVGLEHFLTTLFPYPLSPTQQG